MLEPFEVANLFVMGCSQHSKHLDGGDAVAPDATASTAGTLS
nr:hypothetical protein [Halorubellus sp. JP-L1]